MALDESSLSSRERKIYRRAAQLLERGVDAPAFSARFFGSNGELTQLGEGLEARREILDSDLYRWLKARYNELRLQDAARFEQETRSAAGRRRGSVRAEEARGRDRESHAAPTVCGLRIKEEKPSTSGRRPRRGSGAAPCRPGALGA